MPIHFLSISAQAHFIVALYVIGFALVIIFAILLSISRKTKSTKKEAHSMGIRTKDEDGTIQEYTITMDDKNLNKLRDILNI